MTIPREPNPAAAFRPSLGGSTRPSLKGRKGKFSLTKREFKAELWAREVLKEIPLGIFKNVAPCYLSKDLKIFLAACRFGERAIKDLPPRKKNEYILVVDTFYPEDLTAYLLKIKKIDTENIIFLSNTEEMHSARLTHGIGSCFVNHNCLIDEGIFRILPGVQKKYEAVYTGRFSRRPKNPEWNYEFKRHYLTSELENLVLVESLRGDLTDFSMRKEYTEKKNVSYHNKKKLSSAEVVEVLNQCRVGLILSALEGANCAVGEYLLCGLPVVSTPSKGGRDVWFDPDNSSLCEPTPQSVQKAVCRFLEVPPDPYKIRENFLAKAWEHRRRLVRDVFKRLIEKHEKKANRLLVFLDDEMFFLKIQSALRFGKIDVDLVGMFLNNWWKSREKTGANRSAYAAL